MPDIIGLNYLGLYPTALDEAKTLSTGSRALQKAVSFRNELKSRIIRKASDVNSTVSDMGSLAKVHKRKPVARTGSFDDGSGGKVKAQKTVCILVSTLDICGKKAKYAAMS